MLITELWCVDFQTLELAVSPCFHHTNHLPVVAPQLVYRLDSASKHVETVPLNYRLNHANAIF